MFRSGDLVGSRAEAVLATALEKRSLMASSGNGAVTCVAHLI